MTARSWLFSWEIHPKAIVFSAATAANNIAQFIALALPPTQTRRQRSLFLLCVWWFSVCSFRYNNNLNRLSGSCWMLKMWASWLFVRLFCSCCRFFVRFFFYSLDILCSWCYFFFLSSSLRSLLSLSIFRLFFSSSTVSFEILYD